MHFINNGSVVVLASFPILTEWMGDDPEAAPPLWLLPVSLLLLWTGSRILPRRAPEPAPAFPRIRDPMQAP